MILQHFPSGPFLTNAYIIACKETNEAAIIDPAPESFSKLSEFIESHSLKPSKVILTHSHWDHIADVASCVKAYNIPTLIHSLDKENLESPGSDKLPCWINIEGTSPSILLAENDIIKIGNVEFKVIHTPGHTPGGICLYSEKEKTLISGDTLFQGTIGNISFPTANPESMWSSLDKLAKLPADTKVYPGHGLSTTIGEEDWLSNARAFFGG